MLEIFDAYPLKIKKVKVLNLKLYCLNFKNLTLKLDYEIM